MPAVSGSPTQLAASVLDPQDLAGLPDDAFAEGDLACVRSLWPQSTFRLRRTALPVAANNVTAIVAFSGNGYWELFPQGGSMLSFPTVASLAAFDDQNLDDGAIVYVESIRSYWSKLIEASPGAVDNITYVRNPGDTASWYRNEVPSISWQKQADWYLSTGGDDENAGSQAFPIKTFAEFNRRVVTITQAVVVNVVNDQTERFIGYFQTGSDTASLTISGAPEIVTTSNNADVPAYANPTPAANLRGTVAAASLNFATYVGQFVESADGYVAPVLSNLGVTGYTPFWVKEDGTFGTPAGGSQITVFYPRTVPSILVQFNGPVDIRYVKLTDATLGQTPQVDGSMVTYWACEVNSTYVFSASENKFIGCLLSGTQLTLFFSNGRLAEFIGGGCTRPASLLTGSALVTFKGFIFQGGDLQLPGLSSGIAYIRASAVDENYGLGIFGAAAVGLTVRYDAVFKCGALYGVNGTYGAAVEMGGTLEVKDGYTPSITGATSDFIVDGNVALTTISPLQPGVAVPTAKDYSGVNGVGWGKWNNPVGDFNRKLVSYSTLAAITSYGP